MGVQWKPIPGYFDYYEASNQGQVRSVGLYLRGHYRRRRRPITLKPNPARGVNEHLHVALTKKGETRTVLVAWCVLAAFKGQPPAGKPHSWHRNADLTDNRPSNLVWSERPEHALRFTTPADHAAVRQLRRQRWGWKRIGHELGLAPTTARSLYQSSVRWIV